MPASAASRGAGLLGERDVAEVPGRPSRHREVGHGARHVRRTSSEGQDSTLVGCGLPRKSAFSAAIRASSQPRTDRDLRPAASPPASPPARSAERSSRPPSAHPDTSRPCPRASPAVAASIAEPSTGHRARPAGFRIGRRYLGGVEGCGLQVPRRRADHAARRLRGQRSRAASSPQRALVRLVGLDDPRHQRVADHVLGGEVVEADALARPSGCRSASARPEATPRGRSIWVRSPVTTMRLPSPRRVRNIFICIVVAFCASSSTTKAFDSVRPRMKASGAISIRFSSISFSTCFRRQEVVQRVVERLHVGIDLLLHVAGQEAQPFARLDRRARQDDLVDRARR